MNISTYIERKYILSNTLSRIKPNGELVIIENGKEYTKEEFAKKYPLPLSFVFWNKENADGTKSFLYTE